MAQTLRFDYKDGNLPVQFTPNQARELVAMAHDWQERAGTKGSGALAQAVRKLEQLLPLETY